MRTMQATDAKARLAELPRAVEGGETIAYVIPARVDERRDRRQAVVRFRRRREAWRPVAMSVDDILLARHDGHRL